MPPARRTAAGLTLVVVVLAVGACWAIYAQSPGLPAVGLTPILLTVAAGMVADLRPVKEKNGVTVSIAGIAYRAAVLLSPHWTTVILIATARGVREVTQQREEVVLRATFNVACHAAWVSAMILVYRACGGVPFVSLQPPTIPHWATVAGWAGAGAYIVGILVNTVLTYTVVTAYQRDPVREIWRGVVRVLWDLEIPLQAPIIVVYAWLYVAQGPVAGLALLGVMYIYREMWGSKKREEQWSKQVLELMVNNLEASNAYTSGHSRRVQRNCQLIARELKLPAKTQALVSAAGLLHDVGKIYDKYRPLLKKDEPLTENEWVTMKQHPEDGAKLLVPVDGLRDLVDPVLHHHERWDGRGYPHGLAGTNIPLIARIIALADTIDAMASARPYRPGMDADAIITELRRCRDTQFDPTIVDVLLANEALVPEMVSLGGRPERPTSGSHLVLLREGTDALVPEAMAQARRTAELFRRALAR